MRARAREDSAMVSGTVRLWTNWPFRRHRMRPASERIFRRWETVAGGTPRAATSPPQTISFLAEMGSKIMEPVAPAKAFEIFSDRVGSMVEGASFAEATV